MRPLQFAEISVCLPGSRSDLSTAMGPCKSKYWGSSLARLPFLRPGNCLMQLYLKPSRSRQNTDYVGDMICYSKIVFYLFQDATRYVHESAGEGGVLRDPCLVLHMDPWIWG